MLGHARQVTDNAKLASQGLSNNLICIKYAEVIDTSIGKYKCDVSQ